MKNDDLQKLNNKDSANISFEDDMLLDVPTSKPTSKPTSTPTSTSTSTPTSTSTSTPTSKPTLTTSMPVFDVLTHSETFKSTSLTEDFPNLVDNDNEENRHKTTGIKLGNNNETSDLIGTKLISGNYNQNHEYKPIEVGPEVKPLKPNVLIIIGVILLVVVIIGFFIFLTKKYFVVDTPQEQPEEVVPVEEKPDAKTTECASDDESNYFEMGQYKYTLENGDHWHIELIDKDSEEPVVTQICNYINNIPVTDMSSMFVNSKAKSIDTSYWDTSKVTNMSYMFANSSVNELDLRTFDTSNVVDMSHMFVEVSISTLDLSSFKTSSVKNMQNMFWNAHIYHLDISKFDFSNVKFRNYMFYNVNAEITVADEKTAKLLEGAINYEFGGTFILK